MRHSSLLPGAVWLVAAISLAACAGWTAPAPASGFLEYEVEARLADRPVERNSLKIWFLGRKYRLEVGRPKGKDVTIGGPDGIFTLFAENREWMKRPRTPDGGLSGVPFSDLAKLKQQKPIGSEKVGRYEADIYEDRSELNRQSYPHVWVSGALPVPVKVVEEGHSYRIVRVLKSATFNLSMPDGLFRLPHGVRRGPPVTSGLVVYELQTSFRDQPYSTGEEKIWFKGEKFRKERTTKLDPDSYLQTSIGGPNGGLVLAPGSSEPARVGPHARFLDEIPGVPFSSMNVKETWKRLGSETVDAYAAETYEPPISSAAHSVRVWISSDLPVPVKIVTTRRSAKGAHPPWVTVETAVLKSAKFGITVPESMFHLPMGRSGDDKNPPPGPSGSNQKR